jgi:hypothetical protein
MVCIGFDLPAKSGRRFQSSCQQRLMSFLMSPAHAVALSGVLASNLKAIPYAHEKIGGLLTFE